MFLFSSFFVRPVLCAWGGALDNDLIRSLKFCEFDYGGFRHWVGAWWVSDGVMGLVDDVQNTVRDW